MRPTEKVSAVCYTTFESPVGTLLLAGDANALRLVSFESSKHAAPPQADWTQDRAPFAEVIRQLQAYFRGELKEFDLPLALEGTEFQLRVWKTLRTIPYGETISYAQLAERLGNPKAMRAVGLANGSNPIPIIIPCHRVIGSDGSLTGFGGGLSTKKMLLELESKQLSLL
ncbi:MAG TPA: methylated-DNA--[protein]-cysteine S-methyltransferase [Candidatus Polarisedimenticolia bacterium]|nr:methylated-DNA--[protein]-cysteine S-methyltransferase [Candidatus Polarisedimenticolia bacterium]